MPAAATKAVEWSPPPIDHQPKPKRKHDGSTLAAKPIKCGIGNCKFKSGYATVVGMHRRQIHGIQGQSPASVSARRRHNGQPEPEVKEAAKQSDDSGLMCRFCPQGPFVSVAGRRVHEGTQHKGQPEPKVKEGALVHLNGHHPENADTLPTIEQFSFDAGRVYERAEASTENLCQVVAARAGYNPAQFTATIFGLLGRHGLPQVRQRVRKNHPV